MVEDLDLGMTSLETELLEAARRINSYGLSAERLGLLLRLLNRQPEDRFTLQRQATANLIKDAQIEKWWGDEFELPTTDSTDVVRLVHESTCPTCGKTAYLISAERVKVENIPSWNPDVAEHPDFEYYIDLPEWDSRKMVTVECVDGHVATAEPTMHDWVGYVH